MKDLLTEYTDLLAQGDDLNAKQIQSSARCLVDSSSPVESKMNFLKGLADKGESNEEFSGFVAAFRAMSKNPKLEEFSSRAIDLCGTGGDRSGSFNISTFASIVMAAAGVPVIKHGNRSISSRCGSADLLEALGIPLETDPEKLQSSLGKLNFCFLFAPHFHPAFKALGPTRKALAEDGVITMFNRLGPCLNPAIPAHQILGVYNPAYMEQIAHCLSVNGCESGWIVHSNSIDQPVCKMDELTACGTNQVYKFKKGGEKNLLSFAPDYWGMETYPANHLTGGDLDQNLSIFKDLLDGKAHPGLLATILINVSSALLISGEVQDLASGVARTKELLEKGSVYKWIRNAQAFFSK